MGGIGFLIYVHDTLEVILVGWIFKDQSLAAFAVFWIYTGEVIVGCVNLDNWY